MRALAERRHMGQSIRMTTDDSTSLLDHGALQGAILDALHRAGHDKTLSATDVAQAITGAGSDTWHDLLHPIRRAAVELGLAGRIMIYRKGKPVDPADF